MLQNWNMQDLLIVPEKKAIVLPVDDPTKYTTLMPHAQTLLYKGRTLVAVPHHVDETKLLRNMGLAVPAPLLSYYQWPGTRAPWDVQKQTAAFLTLNNRAFVLNEIGTGKTFSVLAAFDYLKKAGKVNKLLVTSTLSTLERTWNDEIFQYFPQYETAVLHGSKDKRLKLLNNRDVDIYIINHDGLKIPEVRDHIFSRADIDVIAIDELACFRTGTSDRFKALQFILYGDKHVSPPARRIWGMTGTPIPNQPTDAWAQVRLVNPENVPRYFGKFKDMVMRQVNQFKWVPKDNALDVVEQAMQPAIRFTRDQCVDLPPVVFQSRTVEFTPEQKQLYKDMMATLYAENEAGGISAVNEGVKLSKLLQIACGVAYGDDDKLVDTACDTRIDVIKEIIDDSPGKVIVFAPFRPVIDMVAEKLRVNQLTVEVVDGRTSHDERTRIFRAFQKDDEPRVLVAQPAAMSHGLTLTAASTIVWYGAITSNDIFQQANGRITRAGQKHTQLIVTIEGCEAERRTYTRLKNKQSTQGTLLDLVKEKKWT